MTQTNQSTGQLLSAAKNLAFFLVSFSKVVAVWSAVGLFKNSSESKMANNNVVEALRNIARTSANSAVSANNLAWFYFNECNNREAALNQARAQFQHEEDAFLDPHRQANYQRYLLAESRYG